MNPENEPNLDMSFPKRPKKHGESNSELTWPAKEKQAAGKNIDEESNRINSSKEINGEDGKITRRKFLKLGGAVAGLGALELIRRKLGINLDEKKPDEIDKISDKIEENKTEERAEEIIRNDNERAGAEARERVGDETEKTIEQTDETKQALWDAAEDSKDLGQNIE